MLAWCCRDVPAHGSFLQSGLMELAELHPDLQPLGRFGCPVCLSRGKSGWMRPASADEAARFAVNTGE